jgi:Sulfate permease family
MLKQCPVLLPSTCIDAMPSMPAGYHEHWKSMCSFGRQWRTHRHHEVCHTTYTKRLKDSHMTNHIQVRTVGRVPAGLPPGTLRWWLEPEENLADLLRVAAPLALVGLMESIAIAKALAAAAHEDIDVNQELVGASLGLRV